MIYADRNGNRTEKTTGQDRFLEYIYGHTLTRMMLKPLLGSRISRLGGKVLDSRVSRLLIPSFVRKNQIDLSIYEKKHYSSYNDFFTRKILAEERPIDGRKEVLISPCDGKVTVCPIQRDGLFLIKQTQYTVRSLLKDEKLAKRYEGGTAYIIRLTVDDYHRYCYVADGVKSAQRKIRGVFHTVNPVANDYAPIYKMNTREYCLVQTEELGTVLQMEVGALMVGRIKNHKKKVSVVHRGEEKGMFEFGGSTVVLLTEPGKVQTDEDLVRNSATGAETLVKMGEKIGEKCQVLPILSVLLSVGMQLITMRQQKKSGQMNDAMGGGGAMKVMMFVMPVMIGFFSLSYTSAFSLYLVVNYVFSLIINVGSNIILYGIDRHEKKKLETEVHKYGRPDPNDFNK